MPLLSSIILNNLYAFCITQRSAKYSSRAALNGGSKQFIYLIKLSHTFALGLTIRLFTWNSTHRFVEFGSFGHNVWRWNGTEAFDPTHSIIVSCGSKQTARYSMRTARNSIVPGNRCNSWKHLWFAALQDQLCMHPIIQTSAKTFFTCCWTKSTTVNEYMYVYGPTVHHPAVLWHGNLILRRLTQRKSTTFKLNASDNEVME